jgi:mannose-6-phosphate isomerase-like protein (cupin superfamily)
LRRINPHYDFGSDINKQIIQKVRNYDKAYFSKDQFALEKYEKEALSGKNKYHDGVRINSPWGENIVLKTKTEGDVETIIKEITVNPGHMLSLQRHRGREETWLVKDKKLTALSDGERIEICANQEITLPKGNIHCLINDHEQPVTLIETQKGFCREADNIRYLDTHNRPTVPIMSEIEFLSAKLYAKIQSEISDKFGFNKNQTLMAFL